MLNKKKVGGTGKAFLSYEKKEKNPTKTTISLTT